MTVIDLSLPLNALPEAHASASMEEVALSSNGLSYTGLIYDLHLSSMAGTYIDFPGHIKETDDGEDSASFQIEKLCQVTAKVIHLDRPDASGAISASDLAEAGGGEKEADALIINALGSRRFDDIVERSVYLDGSDDKSVQHVTDFPAGKRYELLGVKLFADGAMGSRGAALLDDYSDEKGQRGLLLTEPKILEERVRAIHARGKQAAIHAIGDRGNRTALEAIAGAQGDDNTRRHRIEHAFRHAMQEPDRSDAEPAL